MLKRLINRSGNNKDKFSAAEDLILSHHINSLAKTFKTLMIDLLEMESDLLKTYLVTIIPIWIITLSHKGLQRTDDEPSVSDEMFDY